MIVDYILESRGGKTVLTLVQSGFGDDAAWDAEFEGTNLGWKVFLHNLRHIAAHHPNKPITGLMHGVMTELTDPREAWHRTAVAFYGPEILHKKNGESYKAGGVSGIVEFSEAGKCIFVTAEELNRSLLGFSVMDARGKAMVTWGAIVADLWPVSPATRASTRASRSTAF